MGSIPITRSNSKKSNAHIAQSVEHFLGKEEVTGSNPVMSSSLLVKRLMFMLKKIVLLVFIGYNLQFFTVSE